MKNNIVLSSLSHTWIIDLDGTIVKHNGYKKSDDILLPNVKEFFAKLPSDDFIIIVTSRKEDQKEKVIKFLKDNNIRFNHIIFNLPYGERILVNDKKESGLITSLAINLDRDIFNVIFDIDENL